MRPEVAENKVEMDARVASKWMLEITLEPRVKGKRKWIEDPLKIQR